MVFVFIFFRSANTFRKKPMDLICSFVDILSARCLTWNKYSLDSWNQDVRIYCPSPCCSLLLLWQMQQKGIYTCASAVQFAVYCLNTSSHIHQQVKLRCQYENWSSWNANTCSLPENTVSSCSQPCQSISSVLSNSHIFLLVSWYWGRGVECSAWKLHPNFAKRHYFSVKDLK